MHAAVAARKIPTLEHARRESLALIRSILIDSGPPTALRARFFEKYFYVVHGAYRRAKISSRYSNFAPGIAPSRALPAKTVEQKVLISPRYLHGRCFRAAAARKPVVKRRRFVFCDARDRHSRRFCAAYTQRRGGVTVFFVVL